VVALSPWERVHLSLRWWQAGG